MKHLLSLTLSIPAIGLMIAYFNRQLRLDELLQPTGELSARFMIVAMLATPLFILFLRRGWSMTLPLWLVGNRRIFGIAAFFYAVLHMVIYLAHKNTVSKIFSNVESAGIIAGWLAFFLLIPLATASHYRSQNNFGMAWKKLQPWLYPAAALTLLHWIFMHNNLAIAMLQFIPLAALEMYRIYTLNIEVQDFSYSDATETELHGFLLNDDDFMELTPANSHIH